MAPPHGAQLPNPDSTSARDLPWPTTVLPAVLGDEGCGEVVAVDALELGGLVDLDTELDGDGGVAVQMDGESHRGE